MLTFTWLELDKLFLLCKLYLRICLHVSINPFTRFQFPSKTKRNDGWLRSFAHHYISLKLIPTSLPVEDKDQ